MNYIASIHVLKSKLRLSEADYRALLIGLVGQDSCKAMTPAQLAVVRTHMDKLATRMGVQTPAPARVVDKPQVKKLYAMWWALADVSAVARPTHVAALAKALDAWAMRQVGVQSVRWADGPQLNRLVEELKAWAARVGAKVY
jgi:phage gp16-like protein